VVALWCGRPVDRRRRYSRLVSELVYPPVILLAKAVFRGLGLRITIDGAGHVPRSGGAVIASNHVSYLDFTFVGLGAQPAGRLVRFMAKESVFRHRVSGPLMRGMKHIPVDRAAGTQAFRDALAALKAGEIVGVFPEATISRSFMLKDFKPGAARMAQATQTPLVPCIVWGGQRIYTKGHKRDLSRGKALTIAFGEPLLAAKRESSDDVTAQLRERMDVLLDRVQRAYPDQPAGPDDRWWLPHHLGGTAPTLAEAVALEAADHGPPAGDAPAG
jgi:1-acyl-sn-glycerol-3-phosphate acyltransferase